MTIDQDTKKAEPPTSPRVRIEEVDGGLELSYRRRWWGGSAYLLLWWIGWSVGTIALVYKVVAEPNIGLILFAIPFVTAWVGVFFWLAWMLFGVEYVRLSEEGLEYRAIVFRTWRRRLVPLAELKGVRAGLTDYEVNDKKEACLQFETTGQPLRFAADIREDEQRWLIEQLNVCLELLGAPRFSQQLNEVALVESQDRPAEILRPQPTPVEPPSDSRIEVWNDADAIAFIWQGEWSLGAIAGTTFLTLFWNGIISVFIFQLIHEFNWLLFFFLLPFEAIGLAICASWFMTLTAPLWRLTWVFDEQQAIRRTSIAAADGLGWSKRFPIRVPIHTELRGPVAKTHYGSKREFLSHPDGAYDLYFVGDEDKKPFAIRLLSEGDARWIADVLLRAFPSWFRDERAIP